MKIQQKKTAKKPFVIIAIAAVILAVGAILFLLLKPSGQNSSSQSTPISEEQKNNDQTTPSNKKDEAAVPPSNQTSNEVPVNPNAALTITQLAQQGNEVHLSSTLTATSAGTCVATFTNAASRPVVKEFASNGASACGPLTISAFEFSAIGEWNLVLRFYNQGQQVTAEKAITIQ